MRGLVASTLFLACTAQAADEVSSYPEQVFDDVKHVVTAPSRWEHDDWGNFGLMSLAVVGTAAVIDRPLRDEMRRHAPNNNPAILQVERFGAQYAVGVVGGFYLAGTLAGDEKAMRVAEDMFSASLIASGIITPSIKLVAGRARPYANRGLYQFQPFSNPNASFPSGHTTEAFALAAVMAGHYEETWVAVAAYSVAGVVGIARSYHDAHFASDILAGAAIGTLVGRSVVEHSRMRREQGMALLPLIMPGAMGVQLAGRF